MNHTNFAYTRFPILGTIGIRNKGQNPFVREIRHKVENYIIVPERKKGQFDCLHVIVCGTHKWSYSEKE